MAGRNKTPQPGVGVPDARRRNSNIAYHGLVLNSLPVDATTALDVGCGEGMLCRRLAHRAGMRRVVGIDPDTPSIELARQQSPGDSRITYLDRNFNDHGLAPASFDAVVSVATLHHLDAEEALTTMSGLLRLGGTLVVIGLARSRLPRDLGWELLSALNYLPRRLLRRRWEHPSPTVWPPPHNYDELRSLSDRLLPGSRFRRHLQWRYSLVWTKPNG